MHMYPSDMVLLKRMIWYNVKVPNTATHTNVVCTPLENDILVDINEYNVFDLILGLGSPPANEHHTRKKVIDL